MRPEIITLLEEAATVAANEGELTLGGTLEDAVNSVVAGAKRIDIDYGALTIVAYRVGETVRLDIKRGG